MARNFSGTATTSNAELSITGGFANRVYVKNTGSVALSVNVPRVHGSGDYDTVAPGDTAVYESTGNMQSINVKTASSTTTYTAGVTRGDA